MIAGLKNEKKIIQKKNMPMNSESKAYKLLRRKYKNAFVHKVPDYKQTLNMHGGLPDYLVINNGKTIWYEIKQPKSKKFLSIKDFTQAQIIIFNKMIYSKANIKVLLVLKNQNHFIETDFKKILEYWKKDIDKIKLEELENE
jgi:penicillin-binding protein-related factor A (putative recombinase)